MLCLQTLAKLPAGQTLCKLGQEILSSKLKSGIIRCLSGLSNTLPQEQNPYCFMSTKVSKQAQTYGCGHFRVHEGHGCCIQPHAVFHLDQSCLVLTRSLHNFSSDSRRQVRKAQIYKHYPSSHFTHLRNLRAAIRKVLQKNAKYERKRLSNARVRMRERLEESLEKVKDLRENILTVPNFLSTTRLVLSPVLGYT
ncbi:putative cardiolipin synthase (CMP-forming) [Holothuria leucospilota]|uniref:Cardiolipin synthase (CMP-forming) n=1 Tax=Holothuria leucospilota TaxID=206669 RepID=A0A9Q1CHQ4_HOLLE|nr:putative cardiolipin synthase (CMP-forming) [Holothuria leucospilota]